MADTLTIADVVLADGTVTNLRIVDGRVAGHVSSPHDGDDVIAGAGRLVLPAMAEAHAHLDKAFLAETVPNPTGDLMGAIVNIEAHRHLLTEQDTIERAERAARLIAANGATAIRTHADLTLANGMVSVAALLQVRDRLRDVVDIEVFALCGFPSIGPEGAGQRDLLRDAIGMGIDGIGACPHLESDPAAAHDQYLEIAGAAGLPIDLHTDETLDPTRFALGHLAERVLATGFPHAVTASHCVSLAVQPHHEQTRVAELVASADITVVALPSSNLYLQGREHLVGMPRALTAISALRNAGANVSAGADNLQDPFNPVGRGDCLETAALMVMAGHLLPGDAYDTVSHAVRRQMRRPRAGTDVGDVADIVLIPARTIREAIAFAPADRVTFRAGRLVPK